MENFFEKAFAVPKNSSPSIDLVKVNVGDAAVLEAHLLAIVSGDAILPVDAFRTASLCDSLIGE